MNRSPHNCSVCGRPLEAVRLQCRSCGTALEGHFDLSRFARLNADQHEFLLLFLKSRGNIKEVERALGLSYPTVRSRLDALLQALDLAPQASAPRRSRIEILQELESGQISVAEALEQLKSAEHGDSSIGG